MKSMRIGRKAALAACLMVLAGCLGPATVPPVGTFLIAPDISVSPSTERLELTLGIRPLLSPQSLDKRMAVLTPENSLEFKSNEFWAEEPESSVTRAIQDALVGAQRFADVGNAADMARPDLILTGELRAYYQEQSGDKTTVKVEVRLELRSLHSKELVWADTLVEQEPVGGAGAALMNQAMGKAVGRLASKAATAMAAAKTDIVPEK